MLGMSIHDPDQIESTNPVTAGLALLSVTTRFLPVKATHQVKARTLAGHGILAKARNTPISGYEIHMGQTSGPSTTRPFHIDQRSHVTCSDPDGILSDDGNILGTYIHGLFHNDDFRRAILLELAERQDKKLPAVVESFAIDEQYDRLADHVRRNLDMELILRLIDRH